MYALHPLHLPPRSAAAQGRRAGASARRRRPARPGGLRRRRGRPAGAAGARAMWPTCLGPCRLSADQVIEEEPDDSPFTARRPGHRPETGQLLRWLLGSRRQRRGAGARQVAEVVISQLDKMRSVWNRAPAESVQQTVSRRRPIMAGLNSRTDRCLNPGRPAQANPPLRIDSISPGPTGARSACPRARQRPGGRPERALAAGSRHGSPERIRIWGAAFVVSLMERARVCRTRPEALPAGLAPRHGLAPPAHPRLTAAGPGLRGALAGVWGRARHGPAGRRIFPALQGRPGPDRHHRRLLREAGIGAAGHHGSPRPPENHRDGAAGAVCAYTRTVWRGTRKPLASHQPRPSARPDH